MFRRTMMTKKAKAKAKAETPAEAPPPPAEEEKKVGCVCVCGVFRGPAARATDGRSGARRSTGRGTAGRVESA